MIRRTFRHVATAVLLLVSVAFQGTWALAGTTGGLTGVVVDAATNAPVAGATVTVNSPSQTASGTTDATGHFSFLTLAPDTYTVSVTKSGYQAISEPGQIVFADTVQTVAVRITKALQTIAHVTAAGAGALVKSGTTADIYSINQATQQTVGALGGGGNLNSAYSAISTVPGAYVVPNQSGYMDTVHIRGGDFDQVGYEFDGVPVNRSFDNYASSSASSLGNAEVQVYTGANPANSEGQGLSGYINQVIRTGTYPGFADLQGSIGTPVFFHRAAAEIGGATPDRLFSYYVGIAGYNQGYRFVNNNNGSNYDSWVGQPIAPMGNPGYANGGYFLGPFSWMNFANTASRDVVGNFHIGIPHHHDGGRDDIQVLYDSSFLYNTFNSSTNDFSSPQCGSNPTYAASAVACYTYVNGAGNGWPAPTPYLDGFQWNCPSGIPYSQPGLASAGPKCTVNYYYPASTGRTLTFLQCATSGNLNACNVPLNARDVAQNNQEIFKLQYTKNFSSNAFLKVYGYTYYSNWILAGPQCTWFDYACPTAPDYELSSHTRGVSAAFSDQFNSQNLITLQGSYVTASTIRDNNTQMVNFTGGGIRGQAAVLVNAGEPYAGYCYNTTGGAAVLCAPPGAANFGGANNANSWVSWAGLQGGGVPAIAPGTTCPLAGSSTNKCTYLLAENSYWATYNNVQPQFASASLVDEYRPTDKFLFNLGLRLDSFTFNGKNGDIFGNGGQARQFFYNAYNLDTCVNTATGAQIPNSSPGAPCPSGTHAAALVNIPYQSFTFNIWQPRFSGTYTVSPDTVIRASAGRYTQAPNAAYEIYNTLENDMPFALLGPNLYPYGRNAPGLPIQPPTSINYDVSWEQHVHGTDWSFKLTPFLRQTQEQVQNFFLNQQTGFISGTNVGSQRSEGLEFQLQKGDFSRNGISGLLSFAYTNSYVKYGTLPNSTGTIISPINATIANYNAFTKACAPGGAFYGKSQYGQPLCGSTGSGAGAARCYAGGMEDPNCVDLIVGGKVYRPVANPYWTAGGQSLIDPGQNFATYDIFPAGIGSSTQAFGSPYVATLVLNYKQPKWSVTPSFQFQGGNRYGAPETVPGIDPTTCKPIWAGTTRYDASHCGGQIVIPDPYTGVFDNLGAFVQPNEFMMNFQASYEVTPRIQLTAVLANIVNTCWGGTKAPWTYGDNNICAYGPVGNGLINPVGSTTCLKNSGVTCNPGQQIQPFLYYPYEPQFGPALVSALNNSTKAPFQVYFAANIKI